MANVQDRYSESNNLQAHHRQPLPTAKRPLYQISSRLLVLWAVIIVRDLSALSQPRLALWLGLFRQVYSHPISSLWRLANLRDLYAARVARGASVR